MDSNIRQRNKTQESRKAGRSKASAIIFSLLVCAILISTGFAPAPTSAQSGRRPDAPQESKPAQSSKAPQTSQPPATRPRRVNEDNPDQDQDQDAVKLNANLVTVITSVTDATGNHVNDLTAKDFAVYEDATPQAIAGFYRENQLPLRLVYLFDTSTSIRHRFAFEQRAASQFFRQLIQPADQAAIISVSTEPKMEIQFTSNIDQLINALMGMKAEGATALYSAMSEAAKYLRPAEGRHVIVILSDGTDTTSSITLAQALADVQKADAVVYCVHSTGVAPSANVQDLAGEFVLKTISEDTGGRAFFPPIYDDPKKEARDLDETYKRIAAEVRAQYVLTYYSTTESRPDSFKTIRVEVKRPGLQARARRGYYTSKP